jgi:hypothetical protein
LHEAEVCEILGIKISRDEGKTGLGVIVNDSLLVIAEGGEGMKT